MNDSGERPQKTVLSLPASGTAQEILSALARTVAPGPEAILHFADAASSIAVQAPNAAPERFETYLVFSLAGQPYGIAANRVVEIVRVADIARIPGAPAHVRGVMNLRGRLLPVVELRTRITLNALEVTHASRIIVVEALGRTLGLLVDAVRDLERLSLQHVEPPPVEASSDVTDYVRAVFRHGDRVVLLVDVDRALHVPRTHIAEEKR